MNGFFNVLKPSGITSSDVVVKIRKILQNEANSKIKTGHLGTLDPLGAGVLPIAVGNAVKLFNYLSDKKKLYRTSFVFGISTDTLDSEGNITERASKIIKEKDVLQILPSFVGEFEQIPPAYSSKSIDGVRAYKLARQGVEFSLKPKKITVYELKLIKGGDNVYTFDILCSGGTYIRGLCRDIAKSLNTCGYMSSIIRLSNGSFQINDAKTIDEIAHSPSENLLHIADFGKTLPKYSINCELKKIDNGVQMFFSDLPSAIFELYVNELPYGIAVANEQKLKVILRYDR